MSLTDITPEQSLVALLKGHVTAGTSSKNVPVYRRGEVSTTNNAEDFIVVESNGAIRSYTHEIDCVSGYLMATYYTKLKSDGTIRFLRIDKVLDQIEAACSDATDKKYFYELDRANPVTPPTARQDIGYSYMRVNIRWHTK